MGDPASNCVSELEDEGDAHCNSPASGNTRLASGDLTCSRHLRVWKMFTGTAGWLAGGLAGSTVISFAQLNCIRNKILSSANGRLGGARSEQGNRSLLLSSLARSLVDLNQAGSWKYRNVHANMLSLTCKRGPCSCLMEHCTT